MRRFVGLSVLLVCFSLAASITAGAAVRLAKCDDGGSCPAPAASSRSTVAEAGCSVSISGCHGVGGCASCTCGQYNCGCSCKKSGGSAAVYSGEGCTSSDDNLASNEFEARDFNFTRPRCLVTEDEEYVGFTSSTDAFEFSMDATFAGPGAYDGFIGFIRESAPAGWKVIAVVEVDPNRRAKYDNAGKSESAAAAINQIARLFGLCVQVSDANQTIIFHGC